MSVEVSAAQLKFESSPTFARPVVASTAAGPARQFRVQFRDEQESSWQRYASFRRSDQAHSCVARLHNEGYAARLVQFLIAPSAG